MARIFVAVEPPHRVREELWQVLQPWRIRWPTVRWEGVEKLHFTLKFLGEIAPDRVEAACRATRRAAEGVAAFEATLGGVGCYPSLKNPRVVWVGLTEGIGQMAALHGRLEEELEQMGFPRDARPFSPHLTVGRTREGTRLPNWDACVVPFIQFPVDRLVVKQSTLAPGGSVYTDRASWPLSGQTQKE